MFASLQLVELPQHALHTREGAVDHLVDLLLVLDQIGHQIDLRGLKSAQLLGRLDVLLIG